MANIVKQKLLNGQVTLGGWVMLGHPGVAQILSACGFDWVAVDMEHAAIDIENLENLFRAVELHGALPFVRLPGHDPIVLKRCLDAGARGLIFPMVNSADQARELVAHAKYPPVGCRGASLVRAARYGLTFADYYKNHNDDVVLVMMIEHIDAVDRIEEIVAVDGIDALFFGPYDLTSSMNIVGQLDHPKFLAAVEKVKSAARKAGVPLGMHVVPPDLSLLKQRISEGYQFIGASIDTQILLHFGKQLVNVLNG